MAREQITTRGFVYLALILQFVPLALFPPETFATGAQQQQVWLPVGLAIMALVAVLALLVWRSLQAWPWYLIAFAQGGNIISRILMLWEHATISAGEGAVALNAPYVILTAVAMALSVGFLWYMELPEVRANLLR